MIKYTQVFGKLMDISSYFVINIPLFTISIVMVFLAFRNLRVRKKESIFFLVFTLIVLVLSVVVFMEKYSQAKGLPEVGTVFTSLGYILRPILLYIFILLTNMEFKRGRGFYLLVTVPLLVNLLVYLIPVIFMKVEPLAKLIFYYQMNDDGVSASFMRGTFLNFISHAICLFYLGVSVYVSTVRFHGKHRRDGMVIIMCVVLVLATVAAEMLTTRNDLLNIVCEICAMVNYIFIMTINSSRDPLTNLYDRRTYLEDLSRYQDIVNGVIMIDMNELKFVNDNYGHQTGDEALISLAKVFESSIDQSIMCAYRVSGDEFTILMFQGKIEQLDEVATKIREKMREGQYTAAIGTCFIDKKSNETTFQEALRKAEELMYIDKSKYYDTIGRARR